ncbi:MAG: hypothetical protein A3B23_00690 [Candidatus Colwellbacteria bacterium RIFCSPLOWO2_01_FULL_48_10]|uniref:M23ase beta-sheet core domain-containing protein n=1 Tax=Candidatus Colwellbacteria bacterium RIFCSPLOWO2_01_FULL_48_10 TaxID=1797690 RepID=A0A1G1Z4T2_9BACT|nr:MAG: hypothetical protein A3B23_00690 [Candidatus Colwellbacteria bacterium RIFCSPLOWO2_01_FULL_48_10]
MKFLRKFAILGLLVIGCTGMQQPVLAAQTPEELRQAIDARAKELEAISAQIQETNDNLSKLQGQGRTLTQEVKKFDYLINQANLGIKSSEVSVQKLGLELDSLNYKLVDANQSIESKKEAIVETLRILLKRDREGILHMLLKNASLVEGVFDIQAVKDLQDVLSANVSDLKKMQETLTETISKTSDKRVAIETENRNLKNKKLILDDQKQDKNDVLKQVKNRESLYQKQLTELESQQESVSKDIAEIERELRAKFDASILPLKRPGVFHWPVTLRSSGGIGVITQHAGGVSRLYNGRPHNGLDIGIPIGTPIMSAEDGIVTAVDNNGKRLQYGRYVLIKHGNNMTTLYAHLSRQIVQVGQSVKRGETIGYSGNTGYSTGPHLHFGVYWSPSVIMKSIYPATGLVPIGVIIDPEDYL